MKLTLITFALVSFGGTVAILSAFNGEAKGVIKVNFISKLLQDALL